MHPRKGEKEGFHARGEEASRLPEEMTCELSLKTDHWETSASTALSPGATPENPGQSPQHSQDYCKHVQQTLGGWGEPETTIWG